MKIFSLVLAILISVNSVFAADKNYSKAEPSTRPGRITTKDDRTLFVELLADRSYRITYDNGGGNFHIGADYRQKMENVADLHPVARKSTLRTVAICAAMLTGGILDSQGFGLGEIVMGTVGGYLTSSAGGFIYRLKTYSDADIMDLILMAAHNSGVQIYADLTFKELTLQFNGLIAKTEAASLRNQ